MKKAQLSPGQVVRGGECGDLFGEFAPERFVCRIAQAHPGSALVVVATAGVIIGRFGRSSRRARRVPCVAPLRPCREESDDLGPDRKGANHGAHLAQS